MATRSEVEAYQSVIDGLSTVAFAQIKALLQSLDDPNPIVFRDALLVTYPELMRPFMSTSSNVAAEWYTTLRANAGVAGAFAPVLAAEVRVAQLESSVRYALKPLFQPEEFIGADVLSLLAGVSQKFIANQGRFTIRDSVLGDPVRVGYARIPRAGCCAFCGLLASRGAAYRSAASAGQVVGAGVDASVTAGKRGGQGKGVKARGSQALGNKFHSHCRCVVVPQFQGGDNDYSTYTQQHFQKLYDESLGTKLSDYSSRNPDATQSQSVSMKETLANWRQANGTK